MVKKFFTKIKFVNVLKDRYKNWEEKGRLLNYLLATEKNGYENY